MNHATVVNLRANKHAMASIQTSKRYSLARALRARATASRLLSPDTGNLKITRTCTMKIHDFILQIARRRRRNYVFSFKRSMGEPLKIEEKCVLAAHCLRLGATRNPRFCQYIFSYRLTLSVLKLFPNGQKHRLD